MTSARKAGSTSLSVSSKAHPRELPARRRREEIAVRGAAVPARGGAAGAFQHHLPAHELAVIFANGAVGSPEAWVGQIGAGGPLPDIAEQSAARARDDRSGLVELVAEPRGGRAGEILPFGFGRQPRPGPAREGVSLIKRNVRNRRSAVDFASAPQGEHGTIATPIVRRLDALTLHPVPAISQPQGWDAIATVGDELRPFAVADRSGGDGMCG